MTDEPSQRPEGRLIEIAQKSRSLSVRKLAPQAGISEGRWRQLVSGYSTPSAGRKVPVIAPAITLAKMARVVGVTPDDLRKAGRGDAADVLLDLGTTGRSAPATPDAPTSEDLRQIRDDVTLPSHIRKQAQAQLDVLAGLREAVQVARSEDERHSG